MRARERAETGRRPISAWGTSPCSFGRIRSRAIGMWSRSSVGGEMTGPTASSIGAWTSTRAPKRSSSRWTT